MMCLACWSELSLLSPPWDIWVCVRCGKLWQITPETLWPVLAVG